LFVLEIPRATIATREQANRRETVVAATVDATTRCLLVANVDTDVDADVPVPDAGAEVGTEAGTGADTAARADICTLLLGVRAW
jgi:hypothetical protein